MKHLLRPGQQGRLVDDPHGETLLDRVLISLPGNLTHAGRPLLPALTPSALPACLLHAQVLDVTTLDPAGTACPGCSLGAAAGSSSSSSSSATGMGPQALQPAAITGDTTAYIIFTSGSTGTPKVCVIG
jgi:acyl-CoA synthetase (AMP-forming)/AMP-acid ligase II